MNEIQAFYPKWGELKEAFLKMKTDGFENQKIMAFLNSKVQDIYNHGYKETLTGGMLKEMLEKETGMGE